MAAACRMSQATVVNSSVIDGGAVGDVVYTLRYDICRSDCFGRCDEPATPRSGVRAAMRPPVPHAVQRWVSRRSGSHPDPDAAALERLQSETAGYAVRRCWADGSHGLLMFGDSQRRVERLRL